MERTLEVLLRLLRSTCRERDATLIEQTRESFRVELAL
jgi:hypothetical protein